MGLGINGYTANTLICVALVLLSGILALISLGLKAPKWQTNGLYGLDMVIGIVGIIALMGNFGDTFFRYAAVALLFRMFYFAEQFQKLTRQHKVIEIISALYSVTATLTLMTRARAEITNAHISWHNANQVMYLFDTIALIVSFAAACILLVDYTNQRTLASKTRRLSKIPPQGSGS